MTLNVGHKFHEPLQGEAPSKVHRAEIKPSSGNGKLLMNFCCEQNYWAALIIKPEKAPSFSDTVHCQIKSYGLPASRLVHLLLARCELACTLPARHLHFCACKPTPVQNCKQRAEWWRRLNSSGVHRKANGGRKLASKSRNRTLDLMA